MADSVPKPLRTVFSPEEMATVQEINGANDDGEYPKHDQYPLCSRRKWPLPMEELAANPIGKRSYWYSDHQQCADAAEHRHPGRNRVVEPIHPKGREVIQETAASQHEGNQHDHQNEENQQKNRQHHDADKNRKDFQQNTNNQNEYIRSPLQERTLGLISRMYYVVSVRSLLETVRNCFPNGFYRNILTPHLELLRGCPREGHDNPKQEINRYNITI